MKYYVVFSLFTSAICSSLSYASDDFADSTEASDTDTTEDTTADVDIADADPKSGNVVSNFTVNKSPANVTCYANPAGVASVVNTNNSVVSTTTSQNSASQNGNNGLNNSVNNNGGGQMVYVPVRVPKGMAQQVLSANASSTTQNASQVCACPNAISQAMMQQPTYGIGAAAPMMPGMSYPGVMPSVSGMAGYAGMPTGMPMMPSSGMINYPAAIPGYGGSIAPGVYGTNPYGGGSAYGVGNDSESSFDDRIKNTFKTNSNTESDDSLQKTPDKYEDGNGYVCKRKKAAFGTRVKNFFGMGKKDTKKKSDNQQQESDNQNMMQSDQQKSPAKPGAVSRLKNFFGMGKK